MKIGTELDAVNTMLAATGEMPVNDLDSGLPVASLALQTLRRESRAVQSSGWWFNRESDYRLSPDTDGHITNASLLEVVPPHQADSTSVVLRGDKVYDLDRRSYRFDDAVLADVVWCLDWEQLPDIFRDYVVIRAARNHQDNTRTSKTLHEFKAEDEQNAWTALKAAHARAVNRRNQGDLSVTQDFEGVPDAETANHVRDVISRNIQAMGWWFNDDGERTLPWEELPVLFRQYITLVAQRRYNRFVDDPSQGASQKETASGEKIDYQRTQEPTADEKQAWSALLAQHAEKVKGQTKSDVPLLPTVDQRPDASDAEALRAYLARQCLAMGWWFNSAEGVWLEPGGDGEIAVPDAIVVDAVPNASGVKQLTIRGGKLYNPLTRSFKFDQPVQVDIIDDLNWEDTPPEFRHYIICATRRQYQDRLGSNQEDHKNQSQDEEQAWSILLARHAEKVKDQTESDVPLVPTADQRPDARDVEALHAYLARHCLAKGWWFNSAEDVLLEPDSGGEIAAPGALVVDVAPYANSAKRLTVRDGKLYNPLTRSSKFDQPVRADIIYDVEWEDTPPAFQRYINCATRRQYQDRLDANQEDHQYQTRDEQQAWMDLRSQDIESSNENSSDTYNVQLIAGRRFNPWH